MTFRFFFDSILPFSVIFFILAFLWVKFSKNLIPHPRIVAAIRILGGALTVAYGLVIIFHVYSVGYIDVISPALVSVAGLFANGREIYHSMDFGGIYSLLYGPFVYIISGFFFKVFGSSIFVSKLPSVIALGATFLLTFLSIRGFIGDKKKLLFFGALSGALLLFWIFSFEARPDVLVLASVALALWGVTRARFSAAIIVVGVAIGIAINLKFTAFFLFFPILFLFWKKFGLRRLALSILCAGVITLAPFVVFPNVNIWNYIEWLKQAGRHGLELASFMNNILYAVFLLSPLWLLRYVSGKEKRNRMDNIFFGFLMLGIAATSVFAAKAGSGQNHIMPFVPILFYGYTMEYGRAKNNFSDARNRRIAWMVLFPVIITTAILAFSTLVRVVRLYVVYPAGAVSDIQNILGTYKGYDIQMGYSNSVGDARLNTFLPLFRPLLVFAGQNYLLDHQAWGDWHKSGAKLPPAFLKNLEQCGKQIWLFPKGTKPFENVVAYGEPLYNEAFYKIFYENFGFKESVGYYDVWICK